MDGSAEPPGGSSALQKRIQLPSETHLENDVLISPSGSISDGKMPKLPIEVMSHVFKFISLKERQNASLVCKEWREAGSYPFHSRNEKFVFRGFFQNFNTLLSVLLKTERKVLNLEFRDCDFTDLGHASDLLFLASKIHYLSFINCKISFSLGVNLFVKCVNLNEFCLKTDYLTQFHCTTLSYFNKMLAEELEHLHIDTGFVHENLKILRLYVRQTDMTSHNIQTMFKIFPNIKRLTFRVTFLSFYDDNYPSNKFSFSAVIQEIISLQNELQYLKIYALEPQLRPLALHEFTRLKEISISLPAEMSDTVIFDFFSRQKCLERISCSCVLGSSFPSRLFQYLIHHCPKLKHLKLKFRLSCSIDVSPETFLTLVSSKLISLTIINANIRPTSDQLYATSTNTTLRKLRIPVIVDDRMQSLFIRSFKQLRYLQLECFSGTVLESIGECLKNLTTLKLSLLSRVPSHMSVRFISSAPKWFLYQAEHCLQSLSCLEYLELNFEGSAPLFDCKFVPLSVRYLRICVPDGYHCQFKSEAVGHLLLALKEKTGLEAIYYTSPDARLLDLRIWLEVCCSLNKLRLLGLCCETFRAQKSQVRVPDVFVNMHRALFDRCPSLRYFTHRTFYGDVLYGYDHVERKMTAVSEKGRFITTENIAGSKVNFSLMPVSRCNVTSGA